MSRLYVAAGSDHDVVEAFALLASVADDAALRCVHGGAVAAALAVCGVDAGVFAAARAAAHATGKGYEVVLNECLPPDAHETLSGRLIVVTSTSARRSFRSRAALIGEIVAAWGPRSAWNFRDSGHVICGYVPVIQAPTGGHGLALSMSQDEVRMRLPGLAR